MPNLALYTFLFCLTLTIFAGITCVYSFWLVRKKYFKRYALNTGFHYYAHKVKTDIFQERFFELLPLPCHFQNLLINAHSNIFIFDAFSNTTKQKPHFEGTFFALITRSDKHFKVYPAAHNEHRGKKLNKHLRFEGDTSATFERFWQLLAIDFTGLDWEIEQSQGLLLAHIHRTSSLTQTSFPLPIKQFTHITHLLDNFNDLLQKEYT